MRGAHAPAVTLWLAALVALLLCDAAPSGTLRDTQAQTERGVAAESSRSERATPPLLTPRYHLVPDAVSSQDISAPIAVHNGTHLVWHIFVDVVPRNRQPRDPRPSGTLFWAHYHSVDLVHWTADPIALAPDRPYDGSIIDTGSAFQHPNGTVYLIYSAVNGTSDTPAGAYDGDICIARARDVNLREWDKLCQDVGGRIDNPTCNWCRQTCPTECKANENSSAPSPFPGILPREAHRDPAAPWLDRCSSAGDALCWYALSGSGGVVPNAAVPGVYGVATVWRTDLGMSVPWQSVHNISNTFFYGTRGVYGQMYSCPDFFKLPGSSDKFVFMHLDPFDPYFIGTYVPVADGGPRFVPSAPFNHTTAMKSESGDLMGPNRALGGGLSIMKSGGVGPNNVMNASSRRVYFGTIEIRPMTIPNPSPDENTTHSNFIASLPRDLSLLIASDGTPRLGFAFVPELSALRLKGSERVWQTADGGGPGAIRAGSRNFEALVEFPPAAGHSVSAYGLQLLGAVTITYDPVARTVAGMALDLPEGEGLCFHCFVDGLAVECIVSNQTNHMFSTASAGSGATVLGSVAPIRVQSWELS